MESALARAIQAAREASLTEEEWAAGEGGGGGGGNKRRRNGRDRGGNKGGDKRKRLDQCAKAWAKLIVEDLQRDDGNGEEAALCACESILSAAASADMRSNKVNLSHFFSVALLQARKTRRLSKRAAALVDSTNAEIILFSSARKEEKACQALCDSIDQSFESLLKESFFEIDDAATPFSDDLAARTWCLVPQMRENIVGTSKTRGVEGAAAWRERMASLCDMVGGEIRAATTGTAGGLASLPVEETCRILHKCNILFRYVRKLLTTKYTFAAKLNLAKVATALDTYFAFCRKVLGLDSKATGGDASEAASRGLSAILKTQSALLEATSGSLLTWSDLLVGQANATAKLALSKQVLACRRGGSTGVIEQAMSTLADWAECYRYGVAVKLTPHALALPCMVLLHLCKRLEGGKTEEAMEWLDASFRSLRMLSVVCQCACARWPAQQMQGTIGMCLVETTKCVVAAAVAAAMAACAEGGRSKREEIDRLERLSEEASQGLHRVAESSSPALASLRQEAMAVFNRCAKACHASGLLKLSSTLQGHLKGMQMHLRPTCLRPWNTASEEEEAEIPGLDPKVLRALPDVFTAICDHNAPRRPPRPSNQDKAQSLPAGSAPESSPAPTAARAAPPPLPEPLPTKQGARDPESNGGENERLERERLARDAARSGPEDQQEEVEAPPPAIVEDNAGAAKKAKLAPPPVIRSANYDDLLSDSDGESLSLDSGLGDD